MIRVDRRLSEMRILDHRALVMVSEELSYQKAAAF